MGNAGDPASGYTGDCVYGYNLDGPYENNMQMVSLETPPFDFSKAFNVRILAYIWNNFDSNQYDHATLDYSVDGGAMWTTIWENIQPVTMNYWGYGGGHFGDALDGYSDVRFRWTMGPTNSTDVYGGWNIDDFTLIWQEECTEATPTPTPDLGIDLDLSEDLFHGGDIFLLHAYISNPGPDVLIDQPFVILLDVYGAYFWFPEWLEGFSFKSLDLEIGMIVLEILNFTWPNVSGNAGDIHFYGALLTHDFSEILGAWDRVTFGWEGV